jgi:Spirocyclase AveC-like
MAVETAVRPKRDLLEERPRADAVEIRKVPGIKLWGIPGLLLIAFEVFVLTKWVTGPNFKRVPAGPTPVPDAIKVAATAMTALGVPLTIGVVYNWLWRPWRREHRVTSEGLMLIWFGTFAWFFDPVCNFFNAYFTYNSWLPNMGSWVADIPGWTSITAGHPGHMQAYPLLFVVPAYMWGLFGLAALTAWFMRWMRGRYPVMSNAALLFWTYWFITPIFFLLECIYMRCGIYGYHGTVKSLTLWYGHYYQMPLYEPIFSGFYFLGYGSLLYFRNDKGETLVERGMSGLRYGRGRRLGLRFAAMSAACAVIYMLSYNIPYWITNNANEPWPVSTQQSSYWTNFICGPETNQACPSATLPIATRGDVRFTPQGTVFVPQGVPTPAQSDQVTSFKTK